MLKIELSYRGLLTIVGIALGVWLLSHLWPVLLLVLISVVLMIGLLPYVDAMEHAGLPRPLAVVIIVLGFIALLAVLIGALVPSMLSEFRSLRDNLPDSAREVEVLAAKLGIEVELQQRAREFDFNELFSGNEALDYGQQVLATTLSLITVVAMTAYLLADTPRLGLFVRQFIPPDKVEDADKLFLSMTRVVGGYLRGQLITSLSIGVFTFVFLTIIGVSDPLAFAMLAALADVVPLVGALVATAPPVAAALQESATLAAVVLIGMMAYQQFEDRLLVPRVYGRMLKPATADRANCRAGRGRVVGHHGRATGPAVDRRRPCCRRLLLPQPVRSRDRRQGRASAGARWAASEAPRDASSAGTQEGKRDRV
jgi:predicted PurR-regulated permease PerM